MKLFSTFFLLLLSTFFVSAQEVNIDYNSIVNALYARQIGPAVMSGRVSSLAAVDSKPEVIYVGSAGGGVWKSISGGVSFRPVFDDYTQSIGKIAIDQKNPETVWVGTGEPWVRNSVSVGTGIYKSTDGGISWSHLGLENSERIADIAINPLHPDTVYVAALGHLWNANPERGVYKTTDGGQNWEQVLYLDENTGAADLAMDPENPEIVYAAMWSFLRQPWFFDSGFTGKSGLFKSEDGGKTWKELTGGLPDEKKGRMAIEVAPSNPDVLYLSLETETRENKGIYRSADKGESWTQVSTDFNASVRPFYFSRMVVDPHADSILVKCGLQAIFSEDAGRTFRPMDGSVHSDVHDVWIDPNNTKHVLLATDGGVYESHDRGYSFRHWGNLPLSQYYRVSVDNHKPFRIYGGLQDNGSWYGPSAKPGGITNADWVNTFGGDGFYCFRHPTRDNFIFTEFQGGMILRYDEATGNVKWLKPYASGEEDKYRFNWNSPIHLSPNKPERIYFGSQYLFVSEDMGESWQRISPDLSTNDPEKLRQKESGGLSIDNSTAENHCTIYAIAESPLDDQTVWAGTDDGNLQVSTDLGKTWTNVVGNIPGLPKNTWVSYIEPGHFDPATAYVVFDGHRSGDKTPYLYKTTDLGKTWTAVNTEGVESYALSFREDLVNPDLLFLGTEFGLYVSLDGGTEWTRFENNVPKVGIRDMVIHPRDHALVLGTHGRGVIVIDDITPWRQFTPAIAAEKLHFFEIQPTLLKDPGNGGGWFGGSANYTGPNPGTAARIAYYMPKRHTFGKMYLEVYKDGELIKTLQAGKSGGLNIVEMPTALDRPKAAPTKNRMALGGTIFGPNLEAGKYEVKLIKGKETYTTGFELMHDPESPYTMEERELQYETVMELYAMTEQLAYIYQILDEIGGQARDIDVDDPVIKELLAKLNLKSTELRESFVALEGDFYVDSDERLRERIAEMYMQVSNFPGKPTNTQLGRTNTLSEEMETVETEVTRFLDEELAPVNEKLTEAGIQVIRYATFSEFKEGKLKSSGKGKP